MKKHRQYLLLLPGLVILLIFFLIPLIKVLFSSFISEDGLSFKAYKQFFSDKYYLIILLRTLKISIITTLICAIFALPTAYFISLRDKKVKKILLAISVFPLLTNSVIRAFAWINILGKNGVINKILLALRIIKEPIGILYTDFSITIGMIYLFLPLMLITLVGVMDNIDADLPEAAESLGANRIIAFIKVILPLSLPGLVVGSILVFTGSLTAYTTPQLLGGNKHLMLSTFIYQSAMSLGDWKSASSISIIMIIISLLVIKGLNILNKKLDKREQE